LGLGAWLLAALRRVCRGSHVTHKNSDYHAPASRHAVPISFVMFHRLHYAKHIHSTAIIPSVHTEQSHCQFNNQFRTFFGRKYRIQTTSAKTQIKLQVTGGK
jgi:hypothetical protein